LYTRFQGVSLDHDNLPDPVKDTLLGMQSNILILERRIAELENRSEEVEMKKVP
jgi:hypothetical protein